MKSFNQAAVNGQQYAVIGDPVAHSLSPTVHQLFAKQFNHVLNYSRLRATNTNLAAQIAQFRQAGGQGLSVTAPCKQAMAALCQSLDVNASLSQAVNTVHFSADGQIKGFNTDGVGLIMEFRQRLNWFLADKSIIILGAGAAAAGIIVSLLTQHPRQVIVVNRDQDKAQQLASRCAHGGKLIIKSYAQLGKQLINDSADIIINATSASLQQQLPPLPASFSVKNCDCYDLAYQKAGDSVFQTFCRQQGARSAHCGLGMLVAQAAQQYAIWWRVMPDWLAVYQSILAARSNCNAVT